MNLIYGFNNNMLDQQIMKEMDYKVWYNQLYEYYKTKDVKELEKLIRTSIFNKNEFKSIIKMLGISKIEFYKLVYSISHRIINKRTREFIRENYHKTGKMR